MKKHFDVLSLGELLLRLSPTEDERLTRGDIFKKTIGGAELNVATGISLMGLRTGIISKIPSHPIGIYAKNQLRYSGVSDDYIAYDEDKKARLGIYYYENGAYPRKPRIVYDRDNTTINTININDFDEGMYKSTRCFHTTGITLALSANVRAVAVEMMKRFKEAGALISFDVNFRGNLWTGDEARECIEEILPYVDIFFCSEDTARLTFFKTGEVKDIMKSFTTDYPISIVASTKRIVHSPKVHTFGATIYDKNSDTFYEEEPYRNIEVVDRIGSGDAFIGGALYGLLAFDMNPEKALAYGNAASALKNTIPGDMPTSDLAEVEGIIKDHNNTGRQSEMDR